MYVRFKYHYKLQSINKCIKHEFYFYIKILSKVVKAKRLTELPKNNVKKCKFILFYQIKPFFFFFEQFAYF